MPDGSAGPPSPSRLRRRQRCQIPGVRPFVALKRRASVGERRPALTKIRTRSGPTSPPVRQFRLSLRLRGGWARVPPADQEPAERPAHKGGQPSRSPRADTQFLPQGLSRNGPLSRIPMPGIQHQSVSRHGIITPATPDKHRLPLQSRRPATFTTKETKRLRSPAESLTTQRPPPRPKHTADRSTREVKPASGTRTCLPLVTGTRQAPHPALASNAQPVHTSAGTPGNCQVDEGSSDAQGSAPIRQEGLVRASTAGKSRVTTGYCQVGAVIFRHGSLRHEFTRPGTRAATWEVPRDSIFSHTCSAPLNKRQETQGNWASFERSPAHPPYFWER